MNYIIWSWISLIDCEFSWYGLWSQMSLSLYCLVNYAKELYKEQSLRFISDQVAVQFQI